MISCIHSRPLRAFLLLTSVLSTLAACDSSGDGIAEGTFDARVSGAEQATLNGQAAFAVETEEGETVSAIGLVNTADDEDAVFLLISGQAKAKAYTVGGTSAGAILVLHGTGNNGAVYLATSGSLTVSRAASDRLTGSFDIVAASLLDEDKTVRLRGSFSAKRGAVDLPDA